MIIAGWCLLTEKNYEIELIKTAKELAEIPEVRWFRCKIWGGGTTPEVWNYGIGNAGIEVLEYINKNIMPVMTEVRTLEQINLCRNLDGLWIGARNAQNYDIYKDLQYTNKKIIIKRHPAMTIDETVGIYNIAQMLGIRDVTICERGIATHDRKPENRWRPDYLGMLQLMAKGIPICFDISHSSAYPEYFKRLYDGAKMMGINDFMIEVYNDKKNMLTDKQWGIDINELKNIIG